VAVSGGGADLFSRKWWAESMQGICGPSMVMEALHSALTSRRPGAGLLHHSDRGVQYACETSAPCWPGHGITAA